MSRVSRYFVDYSAYHRSAGNQLCHYAGIPMIMVSLLGLLAMLHPAGLADSDYFRWDGGVVLVALAGLWYLFLDWRIGAPFVLVAIGSYFIGRSLPWPALWAVFVLGWVLQFIGHYRFEKKSPAFFKNFEHLLIGPLWVFAKLIGYEPR